MPYNETETLRRMAELLLAERPDGDDVPIPPEDEALFRLWRGLVNQRPPLPAGGEYLALEDAYLRNSRTRRGVTDGAKLPGPIALWRGDITTLAVLGCCRA